MQAEKLPKSSQKPSSMSISSPAAVQVIGSGLAGSEAAWQLAEAGIAVELVEMKPKQRTPAQNTDLPAELVCSNSLRSNNPLNAVGLIKEEMRTLNSLIIRCAEETRVPAGDALAVDRVAFGKRVDKELSQHPLITRSVQCVTELPRTGQGKRITVVATGPLTADALADDIQQLTGVDRCYFYDALAPIIEATSIDTETAFFASRYDKGEATDYLNCPFSKEEYDKFLAALLAADTVPFHTFEKPRYFEGCLPVEVMASRGPDTLRYGCMKPVGLRHPKTGDNYYAVVQLRKEDVEAQAYNIVGFQTKLSYGAQKEVFRLIPGLQNATFLRLGAIHRNTYLDSPNVLEPNMSLKGYPHIRFAGQITGVEGYVESAAHGLLTALSIIAESGIKKDLGEKENFIPPSGKTALGALWRHVLGSHCDHKRGHEPQNINWSLFDMPPAGIKKKMRKEARVEIARTAFKAWCDARDA